MLFDRLRRSSTQGGDLADVGAVAHLSDHSVIDDHLDHALLDEAHTLVDVPLLGQPLAWRKGGDKGSGVGKGPLRKGEQVRVRKDIDGWKQGPKAPAPPLTWHGHLGREHRADGREQRRLRVVAVGVLIGEERHVRKEHLAAGSVYVLGERAREVADEGALVEDATVGVERGEVIA